MVFLVLFLIPLVVAYAAYVISKGDITLKELAVVVAVQAVIAGSAAAIVHYSNVHDVEVWNGSVAGKKSEHVSCEHSYSCNCRSCNCDKKGNCSQCCDTCYDHSYDVDWVVKTTNGETVKIARVDRQGTTMPPRFDIIKLGDPTSIEHSYVNYIKGSPDTLFRHQGLANKYVGRIPKHPKVYDYYHIDRIIPVNGAYVPNTGAWNKELDELNAEVGSPKQANVLLVFAKGLPQEYFYALEESWIGGKKNEIVLVMGVDDQLKPEWVTVMAWTKNEMFKVKLRDDVMGLGPLTRENLLPVVKQDVRQLFERKPMADFAYLEASITPSPFQWAVSLIVSLIVCIGLCIYFAKSDPFGDAGLFAYRRNRDLDYLSGIGGFGTKGFGKKPPWM